MARELVHRSGLEAVAAAVVGTGQSSTCDAFMLPVLSSAVDRPETGSRLRNHHEAGQEKQSDEQP
jgi:hypothetical protein